MQGYRLILEGRSILYVDNIELTIRPLPPFRLDLTAWALKRRPVNTIDTFDGRVYSRVLLLGGKPVEINVVQIGPPGKPLLRVAAQGARLPQEAEVAMKKTVVDMLGLNVDLTEFYALSSKHPKLGALVEKFRGLKPTRFPSIFETLANAIACQQVSLNVGLLILSRLAQEYGKGLDTSENKSFPDPEKISRSDIQKLRAMGFSRQKATYLRDLSQSVSNGSVALENVATMDDEEAVTYLMSIRGIGRWSAEYTLLRGLGRLGIFPGDDVGGQNSIGTWMGRQEKMSYERVQELLGKWGDFRGLIYFHLLLQGLEKSGEPTING